MNNDQNFYGDWLRDSQSTIDYKVTDVYLDFAEQVVRRMKLLDMNKAQLAKEMDVSRAYITMMLGGKANFTLGSMVKVANALESDFSVRLCPRKNSSGWFPDDTELVIVVDDEDSVTSEVTQEPIPRPNCERFDSRHFTTKRSTLLSNENIASSSR